MTPAQGACLLDLMWVRELWWHDIPPGTRDVLWRRGWIKHARRVRCNTPDHKHPGYVTISARGMRALRKKP